MLVAVDQRVLECGAVVLCIIIKNLSACTRSLTVACDGRWIHSGLTVQRLANMMRQWIKKSMQTESSVWKRAKEMLSYAVQIRNLKLADVRYRSLLGLSELFAVA